VNKKQGSVLWGANNIFMVKLHDSDAQVSCRFKGKKLKNVNDEYNVLVPGDEVEIELEQDSSEGLILSRGKRNNALARWNHKEGNAQAFAANIDRCFILTSPDSPPFRPRFIDRCLVSCDHAEIPAYIILNKIDQGMSDEIEDRLAGYEEMNYKVLLCSTINNQGMEAVRQAAFGGTTLFMGQSGVGKSSLIKILYPLADAKTGEISQKHNRGRHTTVLSRSYLVAGLGTIIDSPGVREFEPAGIPSQALAHLFRDMQALIDRCGRYNCTHTVESDCAITQALADGHIDFDRYHSYESLFIALRKQENPYL
jgi:ribosome biogenesis GTPase